MSSFKLELVEVQRASGDALDCLRGRGCAPVRGLSRPACQACRPEAPGTCVCATTGPLIVLLVYKVYGDAGDVLSPDDSTALVDALPVHALTSELRQQRRMHVQYAVPVRAECAWAQHLHITSEGYQLNAVSLQGLGNRLVKLVWDLGESLLLR